MTCWGTPGKANRGRRAMGGDTRLLDVAGIANRASTIENAAEPDGSKPRAGAGAQRSTGARWTNAIDFLIA